MFYFEKVSYIRCLIRNSPSFYVTFQYLLSHVSEMNNEVVPVVEGLNPGN